MSGPAPYEDAHRLGGRAGGRACRKSSHPAWCEGERGGHVECRYPIQRADGGVEGEAGGLAGRWRPEPPRCWQWPLTPSVRGVLEEEYAPAIKWCGRLIATLEPLDKTFSCQCWDDNRNQMSWHEKKGSLKKIKKIQWLVFEANSAAWNKWAWTAWKPHLKPRGRFLKGENNQTSQMEWLILPKKRNSKNVGFFARTLMFNFYSKLCPPWPPLPHLHFFTTRMSERNSPTSWNISHGESFVIQCHSVKTKWQRCLDFSASGLIAVWGICCHLKAHRHDFFLCSHSTAACNWDSLPLQTKRETLIHSCEPRNALDWSFFGCGNCSSRQGCFKRQFQGFCFFHAALGWRAKKMKRMDGGGASSRTLAALSTEPPTIPSVSSSRRNHPSTLCPPSSQLMWKEKRCYV